LSGGAAPTKLEGVERPRWTGGGWRCGGGAASATGSQRSAGGGQGRKGQATRDGCEEGGWWRDESDSKTAMKDHVTAARWGRML
jgi:hypothetical protein